MSTPWRDLSPRPYVAVSCLAYDKSGKFPIIWRSDVVRSAKNCWSLPSGLHEIGKSAEEQMAAELDEELGLKAIAGTGDIVGAYENIAHVDAYHWTILLMTLKVESLDTIVMREPDKHPKFEIVHPSDIYRVSQSMDWAPHLGQALARFSGALTDSIGRGL